MFRSRLHHLFLICAIAALAAGLSDTAGLTQTGDRESPQRATIERNGLSAIDRGLSVSEARAPDSPETKHRLGLRTETSALFRVGRSGAAYARGRVIVKFKDGTSSSAGTLSVRSVSRAATLTARPSYANFDIVQIAGDEDAEAVAAALRGHADVEYAQAAYRLSPYFTPNDKFYSNQWNMPAIDMERAWDIQPQAGASIIVAVLDTGVAYQNVTKTYQASAFTDDAGIRYPALGTVTVPFVAATDLIDSSSRIIAPHDFIWNTEAPLDLDGHGTHVAGTIGELTNNSVGSSGVAFGVKIMPVKVLDSQWDDIFGSPNQGTDDVVARGIRYAADNGAKVINMSIGRTGASGSAPVIEDAIKYAVGKGAFVAIAGGNGFEDGNATEVIADIASRVQGAVSVAAIDRAKNRAFYSTTGSFIEVAAPGGSFRGFTSEGGILQQTYDLDLVDTFDLPPSRYGPPRFDALAYFYFIGTSQAAPHVSGVAALLIKQGITSPAALESALEKTAVDLGAPGRDNDFGFGLIEARSALRGLGLAK